MQRLMDVSAQKRADSFENQIKKIRESYTDEMLLLEYGGVSRLRWMECRLAAIIGIRLKTAIGMSVPVRSAYGDVNRMMLIAANRTGRKHLNKLASLMDFKEEEPVLEESYLLQMREGLLLGSSSEDGELYKLVTEQYSEAGGTVSEEILPVSLALEQLLDKLDFLFFSTMDRKIPVAASTMERNMPDNNSTMERNMPTTPGRMSDEQYIHILRKLGKLFQKPVYIFVNGSLSEEMSSGNIFERIDVCAEAEQEDRKHWLERAYGRLNHERICDLLDSLKKQGEKRKAWIPTHPDQYGRIRCTYKDARERDEMTEALMREPEIRYVLSEIRPYVRISGNRKLWGQEPAWGRGPAWERGQIPEKGQILKSGPAWKRCPEGLKEYMSYRKNRNHVLLIPNMEDYTACIPVRGYHRRNRRTGRSETDYTWQMKKPAGESFPIEIIFIKERECDRIFY